MKPTENGVSRKKNGGSSDRSVNIFLAPTSFHPFFVRGDRLLCALSVQSVADASWTEREKEAHKWVKYHYVRIRMPRPVFFDPQRDTCVKDTNEVR